MKKWILFLVILGFQVQSHAQSLNPKSLVGRYYVSNCNLGFGLSGANINVEQDGRIEKINIVFDGAKKIKKEILLDHGDRLVLYTGSERMIMQQHWNTDLDFESVYSGETLRSVTQDEGMQYSYKGDNVLERAFPSKEVMGYSIKKLVRYQKQLTYTELRYVGMSRTPTETVTCDFNKY